ncbi:WXG100 family type VII secretion target [Anaeromicropila herbilytica]|uniref:ESAT-6-like protein n=1 Tax=Anaeromicropila herbilytica TaxID=2785025 RepID=A0A7R7ICK6_9FIRM|nr:hypothetical protein [Anaeromicropila herbilytica]BCN29976.1 hypothetical protein bsdtb5_12710 [Anaeromicropila herbilytica]
MDNNSIEISTQILDSDTASMIEELNAVRNQMKSMFDEVIELNTMWEGPANNAFKEQFGIDHATFTELCTSVEKFIECMQFASKEYTKCESSIGQSIAAITL